MKQFVETSIYPLIPRRLLSSQMVVAAHIEPEPHRAVFIDVAELARRSSFPRVLRGRIDEFVEEQRRCGVLRVLMCRNPERAYADGFLNSRELDARKRNPRQR